ncbi:hypothetical protein KIH39_19830 [Telmatocola sphagniphila]|uniref:Uncharacterized protein n=1 Tax=Telmatocola sphagniphila TaxID=1123043 RepID=A0A8E6B354_9BACT|nr:hypothetical protein [Telmatocola sphagniphila]QVL31078.1 hypothetical protein KIH39_19830 [Telmatocola sphagniphila]
MNTFLIIILLLVLVAAGAITFFYLRFRASPAGAWKIRVLSALEDIDRKIGTAQAQISNEQKDKDEQQEKVRSQYRDNFFKSISVEALDDYPNIGPATIDALKKAGYLNLTDFNRWKNLTTGKIPGIAETKWKWITDAAEDLRQKSEQQLQAGKVPGAAELLAQLEDIDRALQQRSLTSKAEIDALKRTRDQFTPLVEGARRISFLNSLFGNASSGISEELMAQPLPKVGAIIIPTLPPKSVPASNATTTSTASASHKEKAKPKTDDPFASYQPSVSPTSTSGATIIPTAPGTAPAPTPVSGGLGEAECRKILDIDPKFDLSVDLIRRQFNNLTEKNDLAKLHGMDAELIEAAKRKLEKIRLAAETLIAKFGEPLVKPTAPPSNDMRHNPDLDAVFG